jgi:hypothetical protein
MLFILYDEDAKQEPKVCHDNVIIY